MPGLITTEFTAPGAICPECFEKRRDQSLGLDTVPIVTCYCEHSHTCGFWSPISGWALRSPISKVAFEELIDQSISKSAAQLDALRRVQSYLDDRCRLDADARTPFESLYRDYAAWSDIERRGGELVKPLDFAAVLNRCGVTLSKGAGEVVCKGLRVLSLA